MTLIEFWDFSPSGFYRGFRIAPAARLVSVGERQTFFLKPRWFSLSGETAPPFPSTRFPFLPTDPQGPSAEALRRCSISPRFALSTCKPFACGNLVSLSTRLSPSVPFWAPTLALKLKNLFPGFCLDADVFDFPGSCRPAPQCLLTPHPTFRHYAIPLSKKTAVRGLTSAILFPDTCCFRKLFFQFAYSSSLAIQEPCYTGMTSQVAFSS